MPKAKWGEGITAEDIDSAPSSGGERYEGDVPPAGVYTFNAKSIVKMEASTGNDMVKVLWLLDGKASGKKQFDGAPWWDNIVVVKQNMWKINQFCQAVGITGKDFLAMVHDDDGNVLKMGKLVVEKGLTLKASVKRRRRRDDDDFELDFGSYMPLKSADEEAPAKAPKAKKGAAAEPAEAPAKAGKKGKKAKDDAPPF